jgi:hypothetical protein
MFTADGPASQFAWRTDSAAFKQVDAVAGTAGMLVSASPICKKPSAENRRSAHRGQQIPIRLMGIPIRSAHAAGA